MIRTTRLSPELRMGSLAIEVDGYDDWRVTARRLIVRRVAPDEVVWIDHAGSRQLLLALEAARVAPPGAQQEPAPHDRAAAEGEARVDEALRIRVPKRFTNLAQHVACHRDRRRWEVLYRVLWRVTDREPGLLEVTTDDDVHLLLQWEREVLRDVEALKAAVRFRRIGQGPAGHYVAWYAPGHRVLGLVVPFLQRRFGVMTWSVFAPDASIHWNGEQLTWGPGANEPVAAGAGDIETWWRETGQGLVTGRGAHASDTAAAADSLRAGETIAERRAGFPTARDGGATGGCASSAGSAPPFLLAGRATARRRVTTQTAEPYLPAETRSLQALRRAAGGCQGCELHRHATQTVFGAGPARARVVIVGEQPGDHEDRRGKPFVGPAGQLLDEVLAEVGIDRADVYVTNAVKHFKWTPRGKRRLHAKPTAREIGACRPWLEAELLAIRPQAVVCLGATAVAALLGAGHRVTAEHGQVIPTEWAPHTLITYHPSAILRTLGTEQGTELRRAFVRDLRQIARLLQTRVS